MGIPSLPGCPRLRGRHVPPSVALHVRVRSPTCGLLRGVVPVLLGALAGTLPGTPLVAQTPAWEATQDVVIGSADEEASVFMSPTHALLATNGLVHVVDSDAKRISVFTERGEFVRAMGSAGGGPAQFRLIAGAGFTGDTLWAYDGPQRRLTLFSSRGELVRTVRLGAGAPPVVPVLFSAAGVVGTTATSLADDSARLVRIVVTADTLAVVDTLATLRRASGRLRIDVGNTRATLNHELTDSEIVVADPYGSALFVVTRPFATDAGPAEFQVARRRADGTVAFARSYGYDPIRIGGAQLANLLDGIVARFTALPMLRGRDAQVREAAEAALPVPRFAPAVWSAVAASDGTLCLERARVGAESRWLVLDAAGDPIGRVRLPSAVRLSSVHGDRACGIDVTGTDFPRIVCYVVRRSG